MGHAPVGVHGIAVDAKADVIVGAAEANVLQGAGSHGLGVFLAEPLPEPQQ